MSDATTSPRMTHQNKEGLGALLPCPFCGGSKVYLRDYDPQNTWVECDDCQIGTLTTLGWPECVHAWNRRAPDATSQAQLRIYREALDAAHYYIDASDQELEDAGISRGDALTKSRDLREAADPYEDREARSLSQNQEQSE